MVKKKINPYIIVAILCGLAVVLTTLYKFGFSSDLILPAVLGIIGGLVLFGVVYYFEKKRKK